MATSTDTRRQQRDAFLEALDSQRWSEVLDARALQGQSYRTGAGVFPDLATARLAAPIIAASDERLQRLLEQVSAPCTDVYLHALAAHMGEALVGPVLAHLRTAKGERAAALVDALCRAHPGWVRRREARRVLTRLLEQVGSPHRHRAMEMLGGVTPVDPYVEVLRDAPPATLEEWSALGRARVFDPALINLALASFAVGADALAYLLRMDPVPRRVVTRMMAAAQADWLIDALEVAILEKLDHEVLLPLAELGIRLGGRSMGMATAWLGAAKMAKDLLRVLTGLVSRERGKLVVSDALWLGQSPAVADRALAAGRAGEEPDPLDGAALVRQLRNEEVESLVREILDEPRPTMMEPVLRPLCCVNPAAAELVLALAEEQDPRRAPWIAQALAWPDVMWQD